MVRSRKGKASQPEAGRRDRSRDSDGFDNAGKGQQVRQSTVYSTVLHRSSRELAAQISSEGNTRKRATLSDVRFNTDGRARDNDGLEQYGIDNTTNGWKVSYYFTNIPECLPIYLLRQQFEVCDILTNVFISRHRNARGQIYGFVRFSHVKNSDKLSRALNNVWFGHLRVWAREARFDKFAVNDNKPLVVSKSSRNMAEGVGKKQEVVIVTPYLFI